VNVLPKSFTVPLFWDLEDLELLAAHAPAVFTKVFEFSF
jgi:hypothetical protein